MVVLFIRASQNAFLNGVFFSTNMLHYPCSGDTTQLYNHCSVFMHILVCQFSLLEIFERPSQNQTRCMQAYIGSHVRHFHKPLGNTIEQAHPKDLRDKRGLQQGIRWGLLDITPSSTVVMHFVINTITIYGERESLKKSFSFIFC